MKIIQHNERPLNVGDLFDKARTQHTGCAFDDNLNLFQDAAQVHLFSGSAALFDRCYLSVVEAICNEEAFRLIARCRGILFLFEFSIEALEPVTIEEVNRICYVQNLCPPECKIRWDTIRVKELGNRVNAHVFIVI